MFLSPFYDVANNTSTFIKDEVEVERAQVTCQRLCFWLTTKLEFEPGSVLNIYMFFQTKIFYQNQLAGFKKYTCLMDHGLDNSNVSILNFLILVTVLWLYMIMPLFLGNAYLNIFYVYVG